MRAALPQRPRHPEVDQESATGFESDNQILAATVERLDALAGELGRHLGRLVRTHEPRVADLDVLEATPLEDRRDAAAHGLDLGELGHALTLVAHGRASVRRAATAASGGADVRLS